MSWIQPPLGENNDQPVWVDDSLGITTWAEFIESRSGPIAWGDFSTYYVKPGWPDPFDGWEAP